ncbi:DUF2306 domain-containing protein [Dawidia soli]|uniref:DUF2306 domain-containing protein n=1 Tax=Dawidia soli TaxID=2782352 RepID=A0AAP2DCF8_9BACT|nr:DUF2306 domain-containing protein [Dawidia soli]MBT1686802.1 DUF2306 domain-containing protein [Dawidia soli]
MLRYARTIFLSIVLAFFTFLMLRITIPYFSRNTDVGFLRIKQWVIHNDVWRIAFFTHVWSSCFLLIAGFTQFYNPLKQKLSTLHRYVGLLYLVILVFLSGPAGLIMALYANGGLLSQSAFTLLSVLWIYFTVRAYVAILWRDFTTHGNFMIRSYALTLSALTLRAWKYLLVMFFQPHPMDAYMIVAWLGWVPNLLLAEWLIYRKLTWRILSA